MVQPGSISRALGIRPTFIVRYIQVTGQSNPSQPDGMLKLSIEYPDRVTAEQFAQLKDLLMQHPEVTEVDFAPQSETTILISQAEVTADIHPWLNHVLDPQLPFSAMAFVQLFKNSAFCQLMFKGLHPGKENLEIVAEELRLRAEIDKVVIEPEAVALRILFASLPEDRSLYNALVLIDHSKTLPIRTQATSERGRQLMGASAFNIFMV